MFKVCLSKVSILWHADLLLGNYHKISNYTMDVVHSALRTNTGQYQRTFFSRKTGGTSSAPVKKGDKRKDTNLLGL
jgi:hypothetical protein